jgi:hypothetical protein
MTTSEPQGQHPKVRHISTAPRWSASGPPPEEAGRNLAGVGAEAGESTAQLIPLFEPRGSVGQSMRSARSRAAGRLLRAGRRFGERPGLAALRAVGESGPPALRGRLAAATLGLGWVLGLTLMIRATRQPPGRRRRRG